MRQPALLWVGAGVLAGSINVAAAIRVEIEHVPGDRATPAFQFPTLPPPARNDAARDATFTVVDGRPDPNSGGSARLHAGRVPDSDDQPGENFFFAAGTDGGRVRIDLGRVVPIAEVRSYSWHANTRAAQVYALFGGNDGVEGFDPEPRRGTDPQACAWTLLATVDSRPAAASEGGQHAVRVSDPEAPLGHFRYLLFEVRRTGQHPLFDNTFYGEIDVVEFGTRPDPVVSERPDPILHAFATEDGRFEFTVDLTAAPDLAEWVEAHLRPVVLEWYPRIVDLLPGDGWDPVARVGLRFRTDMGGTPASAGGGRVNLNTGWFRRELEGEALGAVVHELVHIVQDYGRVRRGGPGVTRMPGWLVEGIADYIRWFLYEPESRGAEITPRNIARARYDTSYRITANFLDWVVREHDPGLVRSLNAAAREGRYREDIWADRTGRTVQELGNAWKTWHESRLGEAANAAADGAVSP